MRAQLGRPEGGLTRRDLAQIQTLMLCGERTADSWSSISSFANDIWIDGESVSSRGTIDSLADIPNLPNLRTLALCNQSIEDLSPLAGSGIQQLALHGNRISDLRPLAQCPNLQELDVSWNPVTDFSALSACPFLWSLNADATGLTDAGDLARLPALRRLYLRGSGDLQSISALSDATALRDLFLQFVDEKRLAEVQTLTQLESLYLWNAEALTSLSQLSGLAQLQRLFVDRSRLSTLDGVADLPMLNYLNLLNSPLHDLSALADAQNLTWLELPGLAPGSWEPLAQLPRLSTVVCDESQREALEALNLKADIQSSH